MEQTPQEQRRIRKIYRRAIKKIKRMSARKIMSISVRAGIHTKDGQLTPKYGGPSRSKSHRKN